MGNTLNIAGNRLGNTVAMAPRTAGTIVTTAADLFTTLKTIGKEAAEIAADTSQKTKKILIETWTEKTNIFKKALKIAVSPVVAGATVIEGGIRSVAQPVINGIANTRNTGKNTIKNARRSTLGSILSKKPISDFSFDNLSTRKLTLNGLVAGGRLKGGGKIESTGSSESTTKEKKSSRFGNLWKRNKEKEPKNDIIAEPKTEGNKEDEKTEIKSEEKIESTESVQEDVNIQKTKDILLNSQHGNGIYKHFQEKIPGLKMIYDKNGSHGELKKGNNEGEASIIVGEKMPKDKYQIAPGNERKDIEHQKKHLIAHELSHLIINDNSEDKHMDGILNISKKYLKKNQTLTPLAQMKIYKSDDDKAKEDLSEMLAMWMLNANTLNKYLSRLTSDKKEDKNYRKEFNLAKITEVEKDNIKLVCKTMIGKYTDNLNKGKMSSKVNEQKGKAVEMTPNIDKIQYTNAA